jgi:CDP-diacylglycerol---glycerol-3-phosphate 3-phosphatidyltransferase
MIDGRRGRSKAAKGSPAPSTGANGTQSSVAPQRSRPEGLGPRLHRRGVTADQITLLGMFLAVATAVLIAYHSFVVATWLIIVGGLMDALDGAVAKAAGPTSKRGAFFDSTSDRVGDGLMFGGVAWYFVRSHDPMLALLPFAILATGNIVSYERAKAESLGFVAKGGLMERAERLIMLGTVLCFSQFFPVILIPSLALLLGLTVFTAGERFVKVWRQGTADLRGVPTEEVAVARWRTARVDSRWRAWREAAEAGTRGPRVASTPSSRGRARREIEPLGTRVRRALQADSGSTWASVRSGRSPRTPREAARQRPRRWSSSGGLRKRFDASR